jgi:hypothetical protein
VIDVVATADDDSATQVEADITVIAEGTPGGEGACTDLIAAQHTVVGDVSIDKGAGTATYAVHDGWELTETHLHVAESVEDIPQNRGGNPQIGRFELSVPHGPVTTYTYDISGQDGDIIAAHAVVQQVGTNVVETAWGEGDRFTQRNWAMYFDCTEQQGD